MLKSYDRKTREEVKEGDTITEFKGYKAMRCITLTGKVKEVAATLSWLALRFGNMPIAAIKYNDIVKALDAVDRREE